MTVRRENEDNDKYYYLEFVEFIELIGRVADTKFKGSQQAQLSLAEKIYQILSLVLPLVKCKVLRLDLGALEETESDNEY